MTNAIARCLLGLGAALLIAAAPAAAEQAVRIPAPALAMPSGAASETAVLAGGCFWGVQAVYQHTTGVTGAVSGYAGGKTRAPTYEQVTTGRTGHAEAVKVTFDPRQVSFGDILHIYFSVVHDPTQLNRQGPDTGTQYRSAIFAQSEAQAKAARAYIAQLDEAGVYPRPIVTRVEGKAAFHPAEAYHQDYAARHPDNRYIARYDLPKIAGLKSLFPARYRAAPALVAAR